MTYSGHKGFFTFVAALAIVVTTILFLFSFINLQAVCIPERWLMIVSNLNKKKFKKKFKSRKCFGVQSLLYFILLQVLLLQQ